MTASEKLSTPLTFPKRGARVSYYRSGERGEWRWRLQAPNFEVVSSGEGYKTLSAAKRGYVSMVRAVMNARESVVE